MAKAEASVEELVGMIDRGELRLPEMQRRYVWRSTRVRDLLDSLYRGYPSGAILLWEKDEADSHEEEADYSEDELQRRFDKMTFVVTTRKLEQLSHWVKVSDVFKIDEDAPFLSKVGIEKISDPRYKKYSQRLARLRGIRRYMYRMDVLERAMSY